MPRSCLAVLLVVGSTAAAPVPKELKKADDKTRLLGTWVLAKANMHGKEDPTYFWHSMTFDADGTTRFRYKQGQDQLHGYTLEPDATPKKLTWRNLAGGSASPKLYTFRDGRLVMAMAAGGGNLPDTLEPGPGVIVLEYARAEGK